MGSPAGADSAEVRATVVPPPPNPARVWWPAAAPSDRWSPVAALGLPTGEIVVAEKAQNRLFLLRSVEATPYRLPAPAPAPVEWTALSAAPGLSFYALDGPGRKIQQYDFQGNYVGEAIDLERAVAALELGAIDPAGLAVDRSGRAVVTDRQGDRVFLFGPGWSFLGVAGESGSAPGAWRRPGAAAASDRGYFLVADEGNRRIVLLDAVGAVREVAPTADTPRGVIALGDDGFAVTLAERVEIFDLDLQLRETHPILAGPECGEARVFATGALAGLAQGLVVGDGCSSRLQEIPLRRE